MFAKLSNTVRRENVKQFSGPSSEHYRMAENLLFFRRLDCNCPSLLTSETAVFATH